MKKLILSTAIVFGGLTAATAQDKEPTAMNEQKQTAVEAQVESRIEAAKMSILLLKPKLQLQQMPKLLKSCS